MPSRRRDSAITISNSSRRSSNYWPPSSTVLFTRRINRPNNLLARRSIVTDIVCVYHRLLTHELVMRTGFIWPISVVSGDGATTNSGIHVSTPHPMCFMPGLGSRFYHLRRAHIFGTLRCLSYEYGFELTFVHC